MKRLIYILLLLPILANAQVAPPAGVKNPGPLRRNGNADVYATHYNDLGNGGLHISPTIAGRDSLSNTADPLQYGKTLLKDGMEDFVLSTRTKYRWHSSTSTWDNIQTYTEVQTDSLLALKVDYTYADRFVQGDNATRTTAESVIPINIPSGIYSSDSTAFKAKVPTFAGMGAYVDWLNVRHVNTGNNYGYYLATGQISNELWFIPYQNPGNVFTYTGPWQIFHSGNSLQFGSVGSGLSYNSTTHQLSATGGGGAWGSITGTLSSQADLQTALNAKAPLASPALTGTPTAPTASVGTNTTQIATTAFVLANAGSGSGTYFKEVPSGSINSSNTTFTLSHTPAANTFSIFRNGLLQVPSVDYTISGTTITYAYAPTTLDTLYTIYAY